MPVAAVALSSWVADYLELLIADLDRQIDSTPGLLDAMAKGCPSKP
jgi:hypothetical protein